MIHPYPGDAVSVGQEIPVPAADNGGVCSVYADAAVIFDNGLTNAFWFQQEQGETVLP